MLKALGRIEQRIRNIEDRLTGACSFASDRHTLNARVLDETRWATFEVQQARALLNTDNDNKEPTSSA
jgi:hypothetical protein